MSRAPLTTEEFIQRSKNKFGDKFLYDKTVYVSGKEKLILECKLHGIVHTYPGNHLSGEGCRKCSRILNGFNHRLTQDEFIERCNIKHNNAYDYTRTLFTGSHQNVIITCRHHGDFTMPASRHLNNGCGCTECFLERKISKLKTSDSAFISKLATRKNFCNYDFSKVHIKNNLKEKVIVTCKTHGEFTTKALYILNSNYFGCRACKIAADTHDTSIFTERSSAAHNNFYNYSESNYVNAHEPLTVICPLHGEFQTKPLIHVKGGGFCPVCSPAISSHEKHLGHLLDEHNIPFEKSYRKFKDIKEIDIISHEHKIGIEFNGLYWHSDLFKHKDYHNKKTNGMNELGYRLIHIFEDEWVQKRAICKSIILNAFKKTSKKIYARNCVIKEVSTLDMKDFLQFNHIQGSCVSKYRYGLYFEDKLVMIATFGGNRKNLGSSSAEGEFELLRLCSVLNTNIVGGASKLFKHFIKTHQPRKITSYCDRRYGTGTLYYNLGFTYMYTTSPNYFYVKGNDRFNRYIFRKDLLVSQGYDNDKTEAIIMKERGYNRITDCGAMKFVWTCNILKK